MTDIICYETRTDHGYKCFLWIYDKWVTEIKSWCHFLSYESQANISWYGLMTSLSEGGAAVWTSCPAIQELISAVNHKFTASEPNQTQTDDKMDVWRERSPTAESIRRKHSCCSFVPSADMEGEGLKSSQMFELLVCFSLWVMGTDGTFKGTWWNQD